ncbi:ABC transporter permease [bacterium]|nr:ABC transporter permease [bacterium]
MSQSSSRSLFLLTVPLLVTTVLTLLAPIVFLFRTALYAPEVSRGLPRFVAALEADTAAVPREEVFRVLAEDLGRRKETFEHGIVIKPIRHQDLELWKMLKGILRVLPEDPSIAEISSWQRWFSEHDSRWESANTWRRLRRVIQPVTDFYLLEAMDLKRDGENALVWQEKEKQLFLGVLLNTLEIGGVVTLLCLLLGYPLSLYLASLSSRTARILFLFVLLPFWTSLLVRTYSWILLLQREGVVNGMLAALGLVSEPLPLMHNRFAVYVTMTHVLLPFMILPLFVVLRNIPSPLTTAAASLGASPWRSFLTVTLPMSVPGIAAGSLLVFSIALGFYITPALVGGSEDTMLSQLIALNVNSLLNWGRAGALGVILLGTVMVLFLSVTFVLLSRMRWNPLAGELR